jgi:hypothetical protein
MINGAMKETVDFPQERTTFIRSYPPVPQPPYSKYVMVLIICFTILRLIFAGLTELGTDESYYWLYTQKLQWNYFDHPAMVAVWARIFSLNLLLENELFMRMGSIVSAAFATWFLYKATATFSSAKAGWYAAVLLNTSFYASIVAGLFIMPDSPQLFFWTLSLWMISRIIMLNDKSWANWLLFGLAAGLCMMSKAHGAFIPLGFFLYALIIKNQWLRKPHLYVALFVSSLFVLPLLIWNWNNDFVSFRFHGNRVVFNGLNDVYFRNEWFGQWLMNNPVNVVLIALALTVGYRYIRNVYPQLMVLIFIGLPLSLILLLISLSRSVFPHWSGPAYISLIPVAAAWLAQFNTKKLFHSWLNYSIAAFALFIVGWQLTINYLPGTFGSKNELTLGKGDVTLDRYGWKEAGDAFRDFYTAEVNQHRLAANTPVIIHKWWGSHIEYYFCKEQNIPVIGLGGVYTVNHYVWMNERYRHVDRSVALCVVPSDEYVNAKEVYGKWYKSVSLVQTIDVYRNGKKAQRFYVYRLEGLKNNEVSVVG